MRPPSRRRIPLLLLLVAALVVVAAPTSNAGGTVTRATLNRTILNPAVVESSGLARSTYRRSVLWTHNDSGGAPKVYAVNKRGDTRAVLTLGGATARDWEDITTGPRHTIWVGDVGNNNKSRDFISVYRFREPKTLTSRTVKAKRFDLRYPDGRHDSEGVMVNPVTGRLYIVSKVDPTGAIYVAPSALSAGSVNVLKRVASAPSKVTGASFSRDGRTFVLCNYSTAFLYHSLGANPRLVDKPSLRQGESVEMSRGGNALYMGSEGSHSPVFKVAIP